MKQAFTLIELLVVIAIISILMAIGLPVMRRVREQGAETLCKSNLRQMALILKTYAGDHDDLFPNPAYIYHSQASFADEWPETYWPCCRWHDARIGLESDLMRREHPEFRGSLVPYLGEPGMVRCKAGVKANLWGSCNNACLLCRHDGTIEVVPQFTYCMNAYLYTTLTTGKSRTGDPGDKVDPGTIRQVEIRRETHVTRSPSDVFAFGEENSWAINTEGRQQIGIKPELAGPYELSGKQYPTRGLPGHINLPVLTIEPTYRLLDGNLDKDETRIGDAFATCHRPRKGDLNTGHSYVSMLDGHVRQVTVADQLRKSRRVEWLPESRLGPGGNLHLAWPLVIPPPGGWENQ
jgi:prepilin-type N-terminal cleavage/methylation domain-containing protein